MIRKKVDCCICRGSFSVYVYFKFFVLVSYYQVEKVYGAVFFICRVKLYVAVYLVYVHVDVWWANFCFVECD